VLYHFLLTDNKEKNKAEILLLSVAANIVSRHTSMVGVDKDRKEMVVGEMIQRKVPLMTFDRHDDAVYPKINTKNCSLSIVLTATDQKLQKSLKR